jgi:hypothetical protein
MYEPLPQQILESRQHKDKESYPKAQAVAVWTDEKELIAMQWIVIGVKEDKGTKVVRNKSNNTITSL